MPSPCVPCGGSGKETCRHCNGKFANLGDFACSSCHQGKVRCLTCDGTGVNPWS